MIDIELLNQRIVLRCKNNLSFTGVIKKIISEEEKEYLWLITSEQSEFGFMCPEDFIEEIIEVNIQTEQEEV